MIVRWFGVAMLVAGCARAPAPDVAPPTSASNSVAAAAPVPTLPPLPPAPSATAVAPALPPPPPLPDFAGGVDFVEQARLLFRVAACGKGEGPLPPRFDPAIVAKHCDELTHAYADYRRTWLDVAGPFLASLRPADLPPVVVYPFGGGDIVTALATFPSAAEITTISLEPAGDVRPVESLASDRLAHELALHRSHLERLLEKVHSRTDNLEKESQAELPGEVVFDLAALVIHEAQPVAMAYFRLQPDGSIHYVTQADIDAQSHHPKALRSLFDNVEVRFEGGGSGPSHVRVFRHIAFNLDDEHLKADPSLLAYLNARGKVAAMTKAASHLLWSEHFATIRGWLLGHTDWMISDSTGIPPRFARPAGFAQDTYGEFDGPAPFGLLNARDANDFKHLFATEATGQAQAGQGAEKAHDGDAGRPGRELAFRYGYPDKAGHAHLIVTRREGDGGAGAMLAPQQAGPPAQAGQAPRPGPATPEPPPLATGLPASGDGGH
jgi:hypothetical protein